MWNRAVACDVLHAHLHIPPLRGDNTCHPGGPSNTHTAKVKHK